MAEILYIVGGIAYSLFAIQFLISLFGYDSDIDLDLDLDGDADFSLGDLVSFKGFLHLIMGATSYLCPTVYLGGTLTLFDWIIALFIGIIFVVGLYYIYKWCKGLQHIVVREEGELKNREVKIIRKENDFTYIGSTDINGAYDMFTVISTRPLEIGENYPISKFINNQIYI